MAPEQLPLSEPWASSPLFVQRSSCNCQQCAIVLGRTRREVASSSANGTSIVRFFSPASVLERTWLGQKQHQVTLGVRKPRGHLLHGVRWSRQSCPWVCSSPWPMCLGRHPRNGHSCDGTGEAENAIPPTSCHPSAFGNLPLRASSLFLEVGIPTVWRISTALAQGRALFSNSCSGQSEGGGNNKRQKGMTWYESISGTICFRRASFLIRQPREAPGVK